MPAYEHIFETVVSFVVVSVNCTMQDCGTRRHSPVVTVPPRYGYFILRSATVESLWHETIVVAFSASVSSTVLLKAVLEVLRPRTGMLLALARKLG